MIISITLHEQESAYCTILRFTISPLVVRLIFIQQQQQPSLRLTFITILFLVCSIDFIGSNGSTPNRQEKVHLIQPDPLSTIRIRVTSFRSLEFQDF